MVRYVVISLLMISNVAHAGVTASVDRTEIGLGEQVFLSVSVDGQRHARVQLPDIANCEVHPQGQSSQMQIVNGTMTSHISYNYTLSPNQVGAFTIGPIRVETKDGVETTRPILIQVRQAAQVPENARDLFLETQVSNEAPFVGEQLVFRLRFFRRVPIGNASVQLPDFAGFFVQDLGKQVDYDTVVNGQRYQITEIKKVLFADKAGTLTIPATKLSADVVVERRSRRRSVFDSPFDDFFGTQQTQTQTLQTTPITVRIRAWPKPTPADFSGLVGTHQLSAELSKNEVRAGDSVTLTVRVSGDGNLKVTHTPKVVLPPTIKVYDDKPETTLDNPGDKLSGNVVFRKNLVPTQPGSLSLDPITLTVLDVSRSTYQTLQTPTLSLVVQPGTKNEDLHLTQGAQTSLGKTQIAELADDILPIYKDYKVVRKTWPPAAQNALWALFFSSPPLIFALLMLVQQQKQSSSTQLSKKKQRLAGKIALASLNRVSLDDPRMAAEQFAKICRNYIRDKLATDAAWTTDDISKELKTRQIPAPTIEDFKICLESCDSLIFGQNAPQPERLQMLKQQTHVAIQNLDKALRP